MGSGMQFGFPVMNTSTRSLSSAHSGSIVDRIRSSIQNSKAKVFKNPSSHFGRQDGRKSGDYTSLRRQNTDNTSIDASFKVVSQSTSSGFSSSSSSSDTFGSSSSSSGSSDESHDSSYSSSDSSTGSDSSSSSSSSSAASTTVGFGVTCDDASARQQSPFMRKSPPLGGEAVLRKMESCANDQTDFEVIEDNFQRKVELDTQAPSSVTHLVTSQDCCRIHRQTSGGLSSASRDGAPPASPFSPSSLQLVSSASREGSVIVIDHSALEQEHPRQRSLCNIAKETLSNAKRRMASFAPMFWIVAAQMAIHSAAVMGFDGLSLDILAEGTRTGQGGMSEEARRQRASDINAVFNLLCAFLPPLFSLVSDRVPHFWEVIMFIGFASNAVVYLIIGILPPHSVGILLAITFCIFQAPSWPLLAACASDSNLGIAYGLVSSLNALASTIFPLCVDFIQETWMHDWEVKKRVWVYQILCFSLMTLGSIVALYGWRRVVRNPSCRNPRGGRAIVFAGRDEVGTSRGDSVIVEENEQMTIEIHEEEARGCGDLLPPSVAAFEMLSAAEARASTKDNTLEILEVKRWENQPYQTIEGN
eukprot:GDKK01049999.1.p1 GENE.GDKK01049999.1~~GDKK01049999.1.p1  ORF type:complete len:623 (-),score=171.48 GDKK01049999.1:423-2186(-)